MKYDLDFSEFHPLDHWVASPYCRSMPGGIRRHIDLWHDFQAPDPLGWLLCKLGRHDPTEVWHRKAGTTFTPGDAPDGFVCDRCWERLELPHG